jgi:hypothetical protein
MFCCVYGRLYHLRTLHLPVDRKRRIYIVCTHVATQRPLRRLADLPSIAPEYTGHMIVIDGYGGERSLRCKSEAMLDIA